MTEPVVPGEPLSDQADELLRDLVEYGYLGADFTKRATAILEALAAEQRPALPAEHAPSDPDLSAKLEELLEDLEQIQAGYEMASTAEARDLDAARTICRAAIHALFGSRPALAGSPAVAFSRAEALILAFERAVRDVALDGGPESLENRERARRELYAAMRAALEER